ncbi:Enoyl-CoA hydratase, mitochondrial [Hypsizygus marmoreus]|uniref:Enoyl-CoA hydratase, mitochondrial n=1 Tax=Hypsizygus marmoreus TaxID=39966 RepID=A0A369JY05_HYPMA|nr:Enoyl-CoA hydratase, mitochondrial [Hypsizygus marmoreus]
MASQQVTKKAEASLLIIRAETIEEARQLIEGDVYYTSGVNNPAFRSWGREENEDSGRQTIFVSLPILRSSGSAMSHTICRTLYKPLRSVGGAHPHLARLSFGTTRLMSTTQYNYILTSRPEPAVTLITLNRPKALNALSSPLFAELNEALREADNDDSVSAIVLTGSERAFAAGADIKEMKDKEYADVYKNRFLEDWADMTRIRKPIIAAVSGFALGGGCELALMCDIILASPTAKFGQPEINLGVIPGGGGSQRLTKVIGKSRTMEMVLTGRMVSAQEAAQWGLVSRVVAEGEGEVVKEAISVAKEIGDRSQIAVQAGKEVVNAGKPLPFNFMATGRIFHGLFATKDQKEGMSAFAQKRKANFVNA